MFEEDCLHSKKKEARFQGSEATENFERNCQVYLLKMGVNNLSFTDGWTKENKTVNPLQIKRNVIDICAY